MNVFPSLIAFCSCLFSFMMHANLSFLPLTPEAVDRHIESAKNNVLLTIDRLNAIPEHERNFENMFRPWNRLGRRLLTDLSVLFYLTLKPFPSSERAPRAMEEFQDFLFNHLFSNSSLRNSLLGCVQKETAEENTNPYERYVMHAFLNSIEPKDVGLERLKFLQVKAGMQPFLYLKGELQEKGEFPEAVTVLSCNGCFLPGELGWIFGGVAPWEKRVPAFAEKILKADADVVCLQEIHGEEASLALFEKLKQGYAHFYVSIGPRALGLNFETLGMSSGLFIASKYAIENPSFTLYKARGYTMNWGFFDGTLKIGKTPWAHVYTTHLQSLDYEQFPQIRAQQLTQLIEKMQKDAQAAPYFPYYLCGDLNIPYGAHEPGEDLIREYFYDAFNQNERPLSDEHRTFTDYFNGYLLSLDKKSEEIDPDFQILDYALLLKRHPSIPILSKDFQMQTELVVMNRLDQPQSAITDHHGLLTTIRRRAAL
jgi:endonuclease/exonuclease/phosphatase family metal-dependent hydrolase